MRPQVEKASDADRAAREFLARYKRLCAGVRDALDSVLKSSTRAREEFARKGLGADDFARKLLAQILFLYFLEKTGWFGAASGRGDKNFLRHLFEERETYYRGGGGPAGRNFFKDILEPLFYETLAARRADACAPLFGRMIPSVGGGLFEPPGGYDWTNTDTSLPDELFSDGAGAGVLDVFGRYGFTPREAEPSGGDASVDPEMLGRVFENLLPENLRRKGGAFYTPRAVVEYMCRQCLATYLSARLPEVPRADVESLLHGSEPLPESVRQDAVRVDGLLAAVTVCDPAVGSGAFLVGALREIVRARQSLAAAPRIPVRGAYGLKLHAIRNSLYGVDVDPGAVEVARLRLWLSLVSDEDGRERMPPLPDLGDNITPGDSLSGERPAKRFDVVIANPPFVEFKSLDAGTKRRLAGYESARGKYDLYVPFLEKIDALLDAGGNAVVICPTRFMQRDYGAGIRQFFQERYQLREIIDFGGLQIFAGATNYTGVFAFTKKKDARYDFTVRRALRADVKEGEWSSALRASADTSVFASVPAGSEMITAAPWYFHSDESRSLLGKIRSGGVPLKSLCEGIYQGVATGRDSVFVVSGAEAERLKLEAAMLQPMLRGKDIGPYKISWAGFYVIYPYDHEGRVVDESTLRARYPRTYEYLRLKKPELRGRKYFDASRKLWFELWNQRALNRFRRVKLVTLDNAGRNSFAYDDGGFVGTTTVYSLILREPSPDRYRCLLGVLNSRLLDYYHRKNTTPQAGGFYRYQAMFINGLPVRLPEGNARQELAALVDKILSARRRDARADTGGAEREVDRLVYGLYGLREDEIALVEGGA